MTRASTLLLALLILNTLLGLLCLAIARGQRQSRALRLWGWGLLVYSAGILIAIPEALPFDFRKVVGNALIALTPILTIEGALSHNSFKLNRRWTAIAYLACVLPVLVNHLGSHPVVLVDILAPSPIANLLFLYGAVKLLGAPPPDAKIAARLLAGIFICAVLVWSVRMFAIWSSIGETNSGERADLTIALFSIAQMVIAVASTLGMMWIEVGKMEAALRRLADEDALTGLPNRRATVERFAAEAARASRHNRSFALALFDVDHFKRINDTHGHLAGDAALKHVASLLGEEKRNGDVVGRIGGEEFVVLLAEERLDGAIVAANRLRERVAATELQCEGSELSVSVSGGLAMYPADGTDWDQVFAAADQRLYAAKIGGRNRIATSREQTPPGGDLRELSEAPL
jgi:diguanylate cyclase (GGDEF)-like protein